MHEVQIHPEHNAEPMAALDPILGGSTKDMLDQVAWYARVLRNAKAAGAQAG